MQVKTEQIIPNPNNPRQLNKDKFEKLKRSIKGFPDMLNKRPLVCQTQSEGLFMVIGGNMRLQAAKELGIKDLPITLADDWTREQVDQFIIKDNINYGSWDWEMIANEWNVDAVVEWGLDIPNFEPITADETLEEEKENKTCPHCGKKI